MSDYWNDYVMKNPEMLETCKALDSIDIYSYLTEGMEVDNIMDAIEYDYNDKYPNPPFEGLIFNWFNDNDFMEYCSHRYQNIQWYEQTKFYLRKQK